MEWIKLCSYSRKKQAPKNVHRSSPVPGAAGTAALVRRSTRLKAPQLRLDLLTKPRREPYLKRQIENASTKALPRIQETPEVTQMECLSVGQSVELSYNENRGLGMKKRVNEFNTTPLKDSLRLNSASKESLRNSETTSGMTLPTGVSEFLLDCLDMDSTVDSNTESSDSEDNYSSPEIFRNENSSEPNTASPERCLGCKNSTLLDTSKAINIDKMPQLSNISEICETTLRGQCIISETPSKGKLCSELTNASTTLTGKPVCKMLSVKENTPELQFSEVVLLPSKKQQLNNQQSKNIKCRKKIKFRSLLENTAPSSSRVVLGSAKEAISSTHHGIATATSHCNFKQPDAGPLDLSSVHKVSVSEDIFPTTTDPCVHSEEIVPESLSPKSMVYQCLSNPPEVCCIIQVSPEFRPPKRLQSPLNRRTLFPPPGIPEDIITNPKNWICNNR